MGLKSSDLLERLESVETCMEDALAELGLLKEAIQSVMMQEEEEDV